MRARAAAARRPFRLIDGVAIGAGALLAFKALSLIGAASPGGDAPGPAEPDRLPAFGRVLAHARTNYVPADPAVTGSVPEKKEAAPASAAAPTPAEKATAPADPEQPASPSERVLLERLGERREELQQRSREMEARERLLDANEKRLDAKLDALRTLEERRQAASGPAAVAAVATEGVKSLVTMYETMKPKEAARVFERLPSDVLVPVVRAMNPRKMAEVLAAMSPEAAEKLTVALARPPRAAGEGDPVATTQSLPAGELPALALPRRSPAR